MSKIAVVYWSGTGNTEAMAKAVADGAKEKGAIAPTMGAILHPLVRNFSSLALLSFLAILKFRQITFFTN